MGRVKKTPEERSQYLKERREQNRLSARESRQKRKDLLVKLTERMDEYRLVIAQLVQDVELLRSAFNTTPELP